MIDPPRILAAFAAHAPAGVPLGAWSDDPGALAALASLTPR